MLEGVGGGGHGEREGRVGKMEGKEKVWF
jgi:hypothetical protein